MLTTKDLISSLTSWHCPGLEGFNSTKLGPGKPVWDTLLQRKIPVKSLLIFKGTFYFILHICMCECMRVPLMSACGCQTPGVRLRLRSL